MLIFVVLPSGDKLTVEVSLDDPMSAVKLKVHDKTNSFAPDDMLLVHQGLVLADESKTVGDLGITRETTMTMVSKAEHEMNKSAEGGGGCPCSIL